MSKIIKNHFKIKIFSIFAIPIMFIAILSCVMLFGVQNKHKQMTASAATFDSQSFINLLYNDTTTYSSVYNLRNEYPLMAEHQGSESLLCWSFAAGKALESSLMSQVSKFYNISEIAIAYLANFYGYTEVVDESSDFVVFDRIVRNYGLIFESDVPNDLYYQMTEENVLEFSYIANKTSKNISNNLNSIYLNEEETYAKSPDSKQISIIKSFIKNYGGLFVGLDPGYIYTDPYNRYEKGNMPISLNGTGAIEFKLGHAVCLVGWDDRYNAFLALNSWGVESPSSFEEFYISYDYLVSSDYAEANHTVAGFVYSGEETIELASSSAAKFSTDILENDTPLKNVFCATENIELEFYIKNATNFDAVYYKITKGQEDVTKHFSYTYNKTNSSVEISYIADTSSFVGGDYIITFYEDIKELGTESFYVFSGTEVSYFKLENAETQAAKLSLKNSYITSDYSETYYVSSSSGNVFDLFIYLAYINKSSYSGVSLNFNYNIVIKSTINGSVETSNTSNIVVSRLSNEYGNLYCLTFDGLAEYKNSMVEIEVTIGSMYFSEITSTYNFKFIMSSLDNISDTEGYKIKYETGGWKNNPSNIEKYPNYAKDRNMTKVELYAPIADVSKTGYTFAGWFTSSSYKTQVTEITSEFSGNLTLYAKWISTQVDYFDVSLNLDSIVDYDGTTKDLRFDSSLIYGDTIKIKYTFTPCSALTYEYYAVRYYVEVNGVAHITNTIESDANMHEVLLSFGFPSIGCGHYDIKVMTAVVVAHTINFTEVKNYSFDVEKRPLEIVYDNVKSTVVYDGEPHMAVISIKGVLAEDKDTFEFTLSDSSKIQAGQYEFRIASISNNNYTIDFTAKNLLVIAKKEIDVEWSELSKEYKGAVQRPSVKAKESDLIGTDTCDITIDTEGYKDVGKYTISVKSLSNANYVLRKNNTAEFEITKANLKVMLYDITDRLQTMPENRKKIELTNDIITGVLYDDMADLNIVISCDGYTQTKSGSYKISATYNNSNYNVQIEEATYILTGYYYVTYVLPNGETYKEYVEDGQNPKGIPEDVYQVPAFSRIQYSEKLEDKGEDLYIYVTVSSYTWAFFVAGIVIILGVGYWFFSRKSRKSTA